MKKKEKRKSRRYIPEHETYIYFTPGFSKKGPVTNISRTGLSCIYHINEADQPKAIENKANICFKNFFIGDLNYKIISDKHIIDNENTSGIIARKRTISFENLTYNQFIQIDFFINNYTEKFLPSLIKRCKNFFNHRYKLKFSDKGEKKKCLTYHLLIKLQL